MTSYTVKCHCGKAFSAIEFINLPKLPGREVTCFDDPPHVLEMRNCPCGSTHGVWVDKAGKPYQLEELAQFGAAYSSSK